VRESHTVADIDARTLGERIRDARKRADLSQEDLAREVGLERTVVNKIEGGIRKVTALELSDIAAAIGVRMSTFFDEPVPALVAHRSSQGIDTADSQIDSLLARLASDVEFIAALGGNELDLDGVDALSQAGVTRPSNNTDAEALAVKARDLMGLSAEEPIGKLSDRVANVGLLAFSRDVGKDTADAATILLRRGGVSLVNSHMKVGRRRLALAHELGHYLIADAYTVDWRGAGYSDHEIPLESRLDRFARGVLLPEAAIAPLWRENVARYGERGAAVLLAIEFRVDMATLATRLKELGLAASDTAASVRVYRTTKADLVEMNLYIPLEELAGTAVPQPFARAVVRLVRDERISRERALDLLQDTFNEADLPRPRQRRPDEIWKFVS
jgi:transcriptional regulator with XRE-family HTH domain